MKVLLATVLLFCLSYGFEFDEVNSSRTSCSCGWRNAGRIVGGSASRRNEYPWMTAVQYRYSRAVFCGGSLITPWHVLTAAHCTSNKTADMLGVTVGAHDVEDRKDPNSQFHRIAEIFNHPAYNNTAGLVNDIAVLVTATEVKYTQAIGPVCLPNKRITDDLVGSYLKATGWGRYDPNHPNQDKVRLLKEVDLEVIPLNKCRESWKRVQYSASQICVFTPSKDTCTGDSGGPLVWLDPEINRYTVVALVSYGQKQCGSEKPSVNTNVSAFLDWINRIVSGKKGVKACAKV